jgi:hypothetical protein
MQEIARYAYAAGHVAAVIAFAWSGLWRRLPVFFATLLVMSVIGLSYQPESKWWIANVYLRVEPLAMLLRLASVVEVARCLVPANYRTRLILGCSLVSLALTVAIMPLTASDLTNFVQARRYVQIATAAWMLTAVGVVWVTSTWQWDACGLHAAILSLLVGKQAFYSVLSFRGWETARQWFGADAPGLLITALCLTLAMLNALKYGRLASRRL